MESCFTAPPREPPAPAVPLEHIKEIEHAPAEVVEPTRPVCYVFRRGNWVKASDARLSALEREGIFNPEGNGDTPTAWRILPEEHYRGNNEWAEKKLEAAAQLPTVSTLVVGFAVANVFELDKGTFESKVLLDCYCFCLATTIAANLFISIVLSFMISKANNLLAQDRREVESGRWHAQNRAHIGAHGEHVSRAHAYIANHFNIIAQSNKLFLMSITAYVAALGIFVVDQLPRRTVYCVIVPTVAGTVGLFKTLFDIGEFTDHPFIKKVVA